MNQDLNENRMFCVWRGGEHGQELREEKKAKTTVFPLPMDRAYRQGMSQKGRRNEMLDMWDKRTYRESVRWEKEKKILTE